MQEARATLSENGRVLIPAGIRKELGMEPGDNILLRVEQGELRMMTLKQRVARAQALVRRHFPAGTLGSEELIAERREAARLE